MAVVSMKQLLEAGCHFGHTTRRWDPRMRPYIFAAKSGIYIIDLRTTVEKINEAYNALLEVVRNGGEVLFVGTKKQAQEAVREAAAKTNQFFVAERWLGGTITNFKTIRLRIKKLQELEAKEESGELEKLSKKEVQAIRHLRFKLEKNLEGIKNMKKTPDALFIVDPSKELIAIKEAKKLGIPVFGIVDTNCDPTLVDYVIPANDDAVRSVKLIVDIMTNAIIEGQGGVVEHLADEEIGEMVFDADMDFSKDGEEFSRKRRNFKDNKKESKPRVEKETKKEEVKEEKEEVKKETKKVVKEEKVEKQPKKEAQSKKAELEQLTLVDLKAKAKELGLKGYSSLKKAELIDLILGR